MMATWQDTKDNRIKRRGKTYWARFMRNGQMIEKSLKTGSFKIAQQLVENLEMEIRLGVDWRKDNETFADAWPDFLKDKHKGIKTKPARPKTLKEYIGFGDRYYIPYFGKMRLSQIDDQEWAEFVEHVRKEKPDIQFDNIRKYMMGFLSWAYRKGKIRLKPDLYDPDRKRRESQDTDGPGLAYTGEQLRVMREIAEKQSPRFYLFMLMAQYMGMRPSEITQLQKDRIDIGAGVIRLRRADTKTAQARVVPIHPLVLGPLKSQMKASNESPYLFPNMKTKTRPMDPTGFKKYWQAIKAELPEIKGRVYDFRHTFITNALNAGINPVVVAKMTGTSLKMMDKRYLHTSTQQMASEIRKLTL